MEAVPAETTAAPAAAPAETSALRHARSRDHGWVWQVTALSVGLGAMLALAMRTTSRLRASETLPPARMGLSAAFLARYKEQNIRLQREILDLRRRLGEYVARADDDSRLTAELRRQFESLKALGGLSAVEGPGLRITLQDSPSIPQDAPGTLADFMIHDQDLNNLLAELKAAGAEHLAISGADEENIQRVIVRTAARCVGPTATVNQTPMAAPYHILALGDPQRLRAYLERPDGWLKFRQLDTRHMITFEEVPHLRLPEYSGTLAAREARPVPETTP